MSSYIQAILFDNKYYTTQEARKWLYDNDFKPIKKVHKTDKYLRYRITEPNNKDKYRIKKINNNINFIIGYSK